MSNRRQKSSLGCMRPAVMVVASACLAAGNAVAFELDTGNDDLAIRWDNTVRYNVAQRIEARNSKIVNNAKFNDGDYSFKQGDLVANRLDLLSELDVVYKNRFGFRVSGAGWYDNVYDGKDVASAGTRDQFGNVIPTSYVGNQYSPYTKRYYAGPSGELLDAFAFGNFDAGSVPVNVKVGRHTVFWGESLFLGGAMHGIAYSQMPLDLQKGFATPGAEAKELFRPLNQVSFQAQVSDNLSIAGQYFLDWEANRYPEGGTYLGPADFAFNGPDRLILATLGSTQFGAYRGEAVTPRKNGEFGLAARWSPEALDGTLGFYYRRYADKMPQAFITKSTLFAGQPLANSSEYNLIYADKIDLFGISLAKSIGGISFGAELSYRHNTPLSSQTLGVASLTGLTTGRGETPGPRGDTVHGLINAQGTISNTPLFDTASWAAELTWAHWVKVSSGKQLFNGIGFNGCRNAAGTAASGDKWDGCATKNYVGIAAAFTPTWYQVMPGVDLSMPLNYAVGLSGNSPTTFGGNEGLGNYSIGLGADIYQKYRVDLKYIDYFGHYRDNGTAVTTVNGFTTAIEDRGFLSLTFKTSF